MFWHSVILLFIFGRLTLYFKHTVLFSQCFTATQIQPVLMIFKGKPWRRHFRFISTTNTKLGQQFKLSRYHKRTKANQVLSQLNAIMYKKMFLFVKKYINDVNHSKNIHHFVARYCAYLHIALHLRRDAKPQFPGKHHTNNFVFTFFKSPLKNADFLFKQIMNSNCRKCSDVQSCQN